MKNKKAVNVNRYRMFNINHRTWLDESTLFYNESKNDIRGVYLECDHFKAIDEGYKKLQLLTDADTIPTTPCMVTYLKEYDYLKIPDNVIGLSSETFKNDKITILELHEKCSIKNITIKENLKKIIIPNKNYIFHRVDGGDVEVQFKDTLETFSVNFNFMRKKFEYVNKGWNVGDYLNAQNLQNTAYAYYSSDYKMRYDSLREIIDLSENQKVFLHTRNLSEKERKIIASNVKINKVGRIDFWEPYRKNIDRYVIDFKNVNEMHGNVFNIISHDDMTFFNVEMIPFEIFEQIAEKTNEIDKFDRYMSVYINPKNYKLYYAFKNTSKHSIKRAGENCPLVFKTSDQLEGGAGVLEDYGGDVKALLSEAFHKKYIIREANK